MATGHMILLMKTHEALYLSAQWLVGGWELSKSGPRQSPGCGRLRTAYIFNVLMSDRLAGSGWHSHVSCVQERMQVLIELEYSTVSEECR